MCGDKRSHVISSQVYEYLLKTKQWFHVKEFCNEQYKVVYLKGKPAKDDEECIIIPSLTHQKTDFRKIDYYFKIFNCNKLTLAIVDSDSTMVFYDMRRGLQQPTPPTEDFTSELNDI